MLVIEGTTAVLPDQFSNCSCKEIILFTNLPKKFIKLEIPAQITIQLKDIQNKIEYL